MRGYSTRHKVGGTHRDAVGLIFCLAAASAVCHLRFNHGFYSRVNTLGKILLKFAAKRVSGIEMRPLPSPFVPLAILCLLPALSLLTVLGYVYSIEWYWVGWSWEKLALLAVVVGVFYAAALLYYTVVGAAAAIVVWATWLMWKVKEPVVIWLGLSRESHWQVS